jgi:site-specific DNA-methyltransferase (adenine-specific)
MNDIPDKSVDMILCDLPYGTTKCKWDVIIPYEILWKQYNRIIKNDGVIALFGTEPFSSYLRISNIKNYKYDWVWDKKKPSGFQIAKYRPMQRTEQISIFSDGKAKYNPIMTDREKIKTSKVYSQSDSSPIKYNDAEMRTYTQKYPQSLLEFSNANQKNRLHPTQKPVLLLEYLITTHSDEGDTILDNCMGSGSTGVAALNTKRRFIGIELDTTYCGIAKERLQHIDSNIA